MNLDTRMTWLTQCLRSMPTIVVDAAAPPKREQGAGIG